MIRHNKLQNLQNANANVPQLAKVMIQIENLHKMLLTDNLLKLQKETINGKFLKD